jgi:hypothetical protein
MVRLGSEREGKTETERDVERGGDREIQMETR